MSNNKSHSGKTLWPPRRILATIGLASSLLLAQALFASSITAPPTTAPASPHAVIRHFLRSGAANMVTALAPSGGGSFWIGTEGASLAPLSLEPQPMRPLPVIPAVLKQYLPKNIYAIAVDKQGRLWIGSLNHGVCVLSGRNMKTYEAIPDLGPLSKNSTGPIGNRIYAIAISPTDASIWIATDQGLSRYEPQHHRWCYYTAADGLPSNQLSALAFAPDGTLYVGTQAAGIAIGRPSNHYRHWSWINGPLHVPVLPFGRGLPSPFVNAIAIASTPGAAAHRSYRVLVGTDDGLAVGASDGRDWTFIRGQNYILKYKYMRLRPLHIAGLRVVHPNRLMSSDYVTAIAAEPNGRVWIGHRRTGVDVMTFTPTADTTGTGRHTVCTFQSIKPLANQFISAIASAGQKGMLVGTYGAGLYLCSTAGAHSPAGTRLAKPGVDLRTHTVAHFAAHMAMGLPGPSAPLPTPAPPPTTAQLNRLAEKIRMELGPPPAAALLGEDWSTQGDWLGHYGVLFARLCTGTVQFANAEEQFFGGLGPASILRENSPYPQFFNEGDFAYYLAWSNSTLRSTLYYPDAAMRREGEWNDSGGNYPRLMNGPDMWLKVEVPRGLYAVSFYFHNKDGQSGMNKIRDYVAMIYPRGNSPTRALVSEKPLAECRIYQFFGGVYCRFLLKGPGHYQVRLKRNDGFWMTIAGMFVDRIAGPRADAGYDHLDGLPITTYRPPAFKPSPAVASSAAWKLWRLVDRPAAYSAADLPWHWIARIDAYRYAQAHHFPPTLMRRWRWKLNLWNPADRLRFNAAMNKLNRRLKS